MTPIGSAGTAFGAIVITNGIGASQATNYVSDTRTLAAGASEILDFNGGLVDSFGNLVSFTRLIFLTIKASPRNVAAVQVDMSVTNGISTMGISRCKMDVSSGGAILWESDTAAAYAVTAGTADLVQLANKSGLNPCTYDIIAVGS